MNNQAQKHQNIAQRRASREYATQLIYQWLFYDAIDVVVTAGELFNFYELDTVFFTKKFDEEFAALLVCEGVNNAKALLQDELIKQNNDKLGHMEHAIIICALVESGFSTLSQKAVTISEALRLAKKFSSKKILPIANAILDPLIENLVVSKVNG